MASNCQELMDVAKRLGSEAEPKEAILRTATNRAYYAAFHAVLPIVEMLPASCDDARSAPHVTHAEVIARLFDWKPSGTHACLKPLNTSAGIAARQMRAAREMRELADYDLADEFSIDMFKEHLARTRAVMKFATQVVNEVDRAKSGRSVTS
jgi:uncharacterized protein (UPF0332 family)